MAFRPPFVAFSYCRRLRSRSSCLLPQFLDSAPDPLCCCCSISRITAISREGRRDGIDYSRLFPPHPQRNRAIAAMKPLRDLLPGSRHWPLFRPGVLILSCSPQLLSSWSRCGGSWLSHAPSATRFSSRTAAWPCLCSLLGCSATVLLLHRPSPCRLFSKLR